MKVELIRNRKFILRNISFYILFCAGFYLFLFLSEFSNLPLYLTLLPIGLLTLSTFFQVRQLNNKSPILILTKTGISGIHSFKEELPWSALQNVEFFNNKSTSFLSIDLSKKFRSSIQGDFFKNRAKRQKWGLYDVAYSVSDLGLHQKGFLRFVRKMKKLDEVRREEFLIQNFSDDNEKNLSYFKMNA